jgi:hypothetical protein
MIEAFGDDDGLEHLCRRTGAEKDGGKNGQQVSHDHRSSLNAESTIVPQHE